MTTAKQANKKRAKKRVQANRVGTLDRIHNMGQAHEMGRNLLQLLDLRGARGSHGPS